MSFLKGNTTDLLMYARNINSHFANKKCQDVIVAARNLMTSEIHNTVKVLGGYRVLPCIRKQLIFEMIMVEWKSTDRCWAHWGELLVFLNISFLIFKGALIPTSFLGYCGVQMR